MNKWWLNVLFFWVKYTLARKTVPTSASTVDSCGWAMEKIVHPSCSKVTNIWLRSPFVPHNANISGLNHTPEYHGLKANQFKQCRPNGSEQTDVLQLHVNDGFITTSLFLPQLIDRIIKWKMTIKRSNSQFKTCFDSYVQWFVWCYEVKGKMWDRFGR